MTTPPQRQTYLSRYLDDHSDDKGDSKQKSRVSRVSRVAIVDHDEQAASWADDSDDANVSAPVAPPAPSKWKSVARSNAKSGDLSPPRKRPSAATSTTTATPQVGGGDLSPPRKTLTPAVVGGLQSAEEVTAAHRERKQQELQKLASLPPEQSGKHAETVYRDATGKRVHLEQERRKRDEEARRKQEREREIAEHRLGTAQLLERQARQQELAEMQSTSFARHADDERMNRDWKQRAHWEDPMKGGSASRASSSKAQVERPPYRGPPGPPNRFQIQPGHRWDGVDRSNGFEQKWFQAQTQRAARDREAYKWATQDM